jgi:hypothetical protein
VNPIPVERLQEILRSIYAWNAVHLRHRTTREREACGCDRFTWIQHGADVPEYDALRTTAGWAQERGPLGFALTDATWIQRGSDEWEAVRHADLGDRRSPVVWYVGVHGRPMRLDPNGGWQVDAA